MVKTLVPSARQTIHPHPSHPPLSRITLRVPPRDDPRIPVPLVAKHLPDPILDVAVFCRPSFHRPGDLIDRPDHMQAPQDLLVLDGSYEQRGEMPLDKV